MRFRIKGNVGPIRGLEKRDDGVSLPLSYSFRFGRENSQTRHSTIRPSELTKLETDSSWKPNQIEKIKTVEFVLKVYVGLIPFSRTFVDADVNPKNERKNNYCYNRASRPNPSNTRCTDLSRLQHGI